MFCGECGAKNEKDANFCEKCGTKLVSNVPIKQKHGESISSKISKMSKKAKIMIGALAVIVIAFICIFAYGKSQYTPEKEAVKYFKAVVNKDIDTLYDFLDVKSSKFTTKRVFKNLMKEELEDTDSDYEILNYKVTDTKISSDGLNATVTIRYTVKGETIGYDEKITLAKGKGKKMLFFDDWKVQMKTIHVIEDYELKVLKDSKVTVAGIKLTNSELNKKKSTNQFDFYTLPAVFRAKYPVVVALPLGFDIETTINPSSYSKSETIDIDTESLSEDAKKKITETIENNLKTVYDSAIANKKFDEIKSNFEFKDSDLKELGKTYNSFNNSLNNRTRKLKEIKFSETEIRSVEMTEKGYLEVYFKTNYDYKATYKYGKNESTSTSDSYMYSSMTFAYQDGYKLVSFDNLNYYFY